MEDIVFVMTALSCAMISFVTWCVRKTNNIEELTFEAKIAKAIEQQLQQFKLEMVEDLLIMQENMINCILYRSVNIAEQIQGMQVDTFGCRMHFNDIHIIDHNGEDVYFKVTNIDKIKTLNKYYLCAQIMEVEFKNSVAFKYIEFVGLKFESSNHTKAKVHFLSDKAVISTTLISEKKNKIYNTEFISFFAPNPVFRKDWSFVFFNVL